MTKLVRIPKTPQGPLYSALQVVPELGRVPATPMASVLLSPVYESVEDTTTILVDGER